MDRFQFVNLVGSFFEHGNLTFMPDSTSIISPVGNRFTLFDLKSNRSVTYPIESTRNYTCIGASPDGSILVAGNEIGEVQVVSLYQKTVLHLLKMSDKITSIKFSPCGKYFAVANTRHTRVYEAPSAFKTFNPYVMKKVIQNSGIGAVHSLWWSSDSNLFLFTEAMNIKVCPMSKFSNFALPKTLSGHSDTVVGCYFTPTKYEIISVSRNGQVIVWSTPADVQLIKLESDNFIYEDSQEEEPLPRGLRKGKKKPIENDFKEEHPVTFFKQKTHYYSNLFSNDNPKPSLTTSTYNPATSILASGFSNGSFYLHEMPDFNIIQSINLPSTIEAPIETVSINNRGDWLAFGLKEHGLLVWDWQSESSILQQHGHRNNMGTFAYSPDARYIATGSNDGIVKVWKTSDTFCFATFNSHTSAVTGLVFMQDSAFISCSLDGTVRAFDLRRYRNFRTMTAPRLVQFICVSVDASKEFVVAGGKNEFDIYMWSLKTGHLLDVLTGHEGPVTSVVFSPALGSTTVVSSSWDKSLRVWESIAANSNKETISLQFEATALSFRPDGKQVAIATLDGSLSFFAIPTLIQTGSIDGRLHLGSGRSDADMITAQKNLSAKSFNTICYSPNGAYILAGGQSKTIVAYDVNQRAFLMKFDITRNESLNAMHEFIHPRNLNDFGNVNLLEERGEDKLALPGVRTGDMTRRIYNKEVVVTCIRFSPTGRDWGATTSEGLLLYSVDENEGFNPIGDVANITPALIKQLVKKGEFHEALISALRLNQIALLRFVVESANSQIISAISQELSFSYIPGILSFLANEISRTHHFEQYLMWILEIMKYNLWALRKNPSIVMQSLCMIERHLAENLSRCTSPLSTLHYNIKYIIEGGAGLDVSSPQNETPKTYMNQENVAPVEPMDTSDSDEDYLIPMPIVNRKRTVSPSGSQNEQKKPRPE